MRSKCRGNESCYNSGCRCEACRLAASVARRERRRLAREAVGVRNLTPGSDSCRTRDGSASVDAERLVSMPTDNPNSFASTEFKLSTSDYAESSGVASVEATPDSSVVAAVLAEVEALDSTRPALVAAAIAMARVLDNPKAVSSQPPAAGQLVSILNQLRKSAQGGKPKLASVRQMSRSER